MTKKLQQMLEEMDELYDNIGRELSRQIRDVREKKALLEEEAMFSQYDNEHVDAFFEKPYVVIPRGTKRQEWLLIIPKFFELNVGYLLQSTKSYNVFLVNKYADYLGAVPKEFKSLFKFKPRMPLKVLDGMLLAGEEYQDAAWERYKKFLSRREGSDQIRIKKGKSFELIANMIDDGILPFMRNPVAKSHRVNAEWMLADMSEDARENVERRLEMKFFKDAINKFYSTGAVGIYWATGVGKTLIGLEALSSVRVDDRPNVVISGTSAALQLQWQQRLSSVKLAAKTIVVPFQSWHKIKDMDVGVMIIDECHHLPANSFSKIATMKCEYRMGLSATPYREDGRSDYIFALTGFPIGLDWRVLIELGLIIEPEITLYLCGTYDQKRKKLGELIQDIQKTLIYCFSIDMGKRLSKQFEVPFVYGDTPVKERLQIIKSSHVTIVSAAMGEGISVRNIERTITYNFLFGSRQEETQFFGRLLHGKEKGKHVIMMTDEEYERYGKRLYGIQEKGFKIQITRVGSGKSTSVSSPKRRPAPRLSTPPPTMATEPRRVEVVDDAVQCPLFDERDEFSSKMILEILKSDYAKGKRGLTIGEIKVVLDHSEIKYGTYSQFKDAIRGLYNRKDRPIARRKDGNKRRYFVVE